MVAPGQPKAQPGVGSVPNSSAAERRELVDGALGFSRNYKPKAMKSNIPIVRWSGLVVGVIAALATTYLFFNPVFINDLAFFWFPAIANGGGLIALILALLSVPSWQSKVTILLSLYVLWGALNTSVGIH